MFTIRVYSCDSWLAFSFPLAFSSPRPLLLCVQSSSPYFLGGLGVLAFIRNYVITAGSRGALDRLPPLRGTGFQPVLPRRRQRCFAS
ncbi:MAG TPA: hypothetical protein VF624_07600, partial [Tepidisphaeraceae bacterium]